MGKIDCEAVMTGFIVESFTPLEKNTLVGFVTIRTLSGLVFHDATVHRKNDSLWVSPAARPEVGADGIVRKDAAGKTRYAPVISFRDKQTRDRWSGAVIEALRQQRPEVLS
jgi:hypothetical protein